MNKKFPIKGHCLSTNPIIVKYLQDNFKMYINNVKPKKPTGVAWGEGRWWYILKHSHTPKYDPNAIINIITKINEMNNPTIATTLSTSSGVISDNANYDIVTTTAAPIYNPNDSFPNTIWINGSNVYITTNLVTEPTKLRIKCRNLKKNLKVSLLQINLK